MAPASFKDGKTSRGIYYRRVLAATPQADARPPRVLVMGYAGNCESWSEAFVERLRQAGPVVVFDNRGTGRSIKPTDKAEYTVGEMAQDLQSVFEALKIRAAHLMGYSLGGCIAIEFAMEWPEQVLSLDLVATTAGGDAYVPPATGVLAKLVNPQGATVQEMARFTWELCMSPAKVDRHWATLLTTLTEERAYMTPRFALEGQAHAYLQFDRAEDMSFPFRTRVITGDSDPLTPPENSERLAYLIEDATLHPIENCEHMPHIEHPALFADLLLK